MRLSSVWINLLILLATICLLLVVAEGAFRLFVPQPIDYFYFERHPKPSTTFERWGTEVSLNSLGYRDIEHQVKPTKGKYRIAVVGDSITYGSGVAFDQVYHQQLKEIINQELDQPEVDVLAFNQGATTTEWAIATYQKVIRRFKPDVILLGFCLNDVVQDSLKEEERSWKRRVYDSMARFHEYARVKSHFYFFIFERSRRFFYRFLLDRKVRTVDSWAPIKPRAPEYRDLFSQAFRGTVERLKRFSKLVSADNSELVVVIFPFEMQLSSELAELYAEEYDIDGLGEAPDGLVQQLLGEELKKSSIKYIDLLPAFQKQVASDPDKRLFFREFGGMLDWAHPNEDGHTLAAQQISRFFLARWQQKG